MKRLLKSLDKGNWKVFINDEARPRTTVVTVDGENVVFRLREPYQRRVHVITSKEKDELRRRPSAWMPRWDYSPTGILALEIDRRRCWDIKTRWTDGKRHRLEDQIGTFIKGLERAAQWLKERRAEREKDRLEWEERQRREEESRLRRLEEERRIQELKQQAANWRQGQVIKEFLDEVRRNALGSGLSLDLGGPLGAWLTWADAQRQALDPIQGILSRFRPMSTDQGVSNEQMVPALAKSGPVAKPGASENPPPAVGTEVPSGSSDTGVLCGGSGNGLEKQNAEWPTLRRSFERVTLYEQVWSQPVQHVAKTYGISGRGLAKACRRLRVPVPPRGYWARIRNGHTVRKPALPPLNLERAKTGSRA
jgi:hypothetical protein